MNVVNRIAIIVRPKQPYADWANGMEDGGPLYVVGDEDTHPTTYPVNVLDGDVVDAVDDHWRAIFEMELVAWMTDSSTWPARRTRTMFMEWFDVQVSDPVIDLGRDELTAE